MIRRLPGVLAILSDIWTFVASTKDSNNTQQQKSEAKQTLILLENEVSNIDTSFDTFRVCHF